MKKIVFAFLLLPFLCDAQIIGEVLIYKKIYSLTYPNDTERSRKELIQKIAYKYLRKFYDINHIPNIYIIAYDTSGLPQLSFDMLHGCIISRKGIEMSDSFGKCGLRIECSTKIETIIKLLDYGINNLIYLEDIKDSILALPPLSSPMNASISNVKLAEVLSHKLSSRKELFIRNHSKIY